jgi:histidinol dehydrogenase
MSRYGLVITEWQALDAGHQRALLRRPAGGDAGLQAIVTDIIRQVREGGDAALAQLTQQFDGVNPQSFEISAQDLRLARNSIDARLADAIHAASSRIRAFHAADMPREKTVETAPGLNCTVTYRALTTVGIYVPGGTAPLVSTVLMLAIPARLAGCRQVVMCSPPGRDGRISAQVLAAASLCGVDRVFCVGGAQAVAAMAYGTSSVPRCSKIFGPGNAWVTAAKQQVSMDPDGAAIDMPAGPSEVMVIADASAGTGDGVDFISWDLLSQAEHGPDSQVLLLTDSQELAAAVIARLDELGPASPRSVILEQSLRAARIIQVADLEQAMAIANDYAPEHLILNTVNARQLATRVEHAGSVFIGRWTPESLGDYCSGTNHVLPTCGFARAHGALGVADFMRRMTLQEASAAALMQVGPCAEILAEVEGLDAHRMAVRSRLTSLETSS